MYNFDIPKFTFGPSLTVNMVDSNNNNTTTTTNNNTNNNNSSVAERSVRARMVNGYGLVPHDSNVMLPAGLKEVDIEHMMSDNPERQKGIMYLQLIRVVSGSNTGQSNMTAYQSYFKNNNKKDGSMNSQYYRLFLFRDITSKTGEVVYVVEGKNRNDRIWGRSPALRDNGGVTIGTYVCIMNPLPVTSWFCNEIPIIESRGSAFVMKQSGGAMDVHMDSSIGTNVTRCFVQNGAKVDVLSTDVHTTKCSGLFCDRQRSMEISRGSRSCGCYSMNIRVSSIALLHRVEVSASGVHLFSMDDFSSLNFCNLYLKTPFSWNIRANLLDFTHAYYKLQECIENTIDYINSNGGFTVIGWYKRGEINDISNDDSQNEVESSEIGHHIVSIYPTNRDIVKLDEFKTKQFDISGISNDCN